MTEGYSLKNSILNAKAAIVKAEELAKDTSEYCIVCDRWLTLASVIAQLENQK